jgi:predicted RNase H-like HicB family nuclease
MKTSEYLDLPYNIILRRMDDESGKYFFATVLELEGCMSDGESVPEAYANIREAMEGWIETRLASGYNVPRPIDVVELVAASRRVISSPSLPAAP